MATCRYCGHTMSDGILTREEETNLRHFRDRMANQDLPSVITGSTTLDRASADRITAEARRAALGHGGGGTLQEMENTLRRTSMSNTHRRQLLVRAWETAVEGPSRTGWYPWTRRTPFTGTWTASG